MKNRQILKRKTNNESGYAMVLVLGIVILTIGILSSMTMITVSDSQNSLKNRNVLEARIISESSLDTIYANLNANGLTDFLLSAGETGLFPLDPSTPSTTSGGVTTTMFPWSSPYRSIDDEGIIGTSCPTTNLSLSCFKARVIKKSFRADFGISNIGPAQYKDDMTREEYTIDIVLRRSCKTAFTDCSFSRMQQTISKRKYIEYVSISQTEAVSPRARAAAISNGILEAALPTGYSDINSYSNNDFISSGNVHTNDKSVNVCNSSKIGSWLTAQSGASNLLTNYNIPGCNNPSGVTTKKATRNKLKLPERTGDADYEGLKQLAKADSGSATNYSFSSNASIIFNGTEMSVNGGPSYTLPSSGVVFLENGGSIKGNISGKITIASAKGKDIVIAGDLRYTNGVSNPTDLIGVNSGRDIIISCQTSNSTAPCSNISIDGFYKANPGADSNAGTIYTPYWATALAGGSTPKINLFGAMESHYRGTLGTIISTSNGNLSTGFAKNYAFDSRLKFEQPPYMLRDASVPFIRSGVKDVPCSTVCN